MSLLVPCYFKQNFYGTYCQLFLFETGNTRVTFRDRGGFNKYDPVHPLPFVTKFVQLLPSIVLGRAVFNFLRNIRFTPSFIHRIVQLFRPSSRTRNFEPTSRTLHEKIKKKKKRNPPYLKNITIIIIINACSVIFGKRSFHYDYHVSKI